MDRFDRLQARGRSFIRYTARPQQHICVVIDLINDSAVEINYDRAEERRLAQSVLDKLATEFRGTVDPSSDQNRDNTLCLIPLNS